jgi:hypothetical protein
VSARALFDRSRIAWRSHRQLRGMDRGAAIVQCPGLHNAIYVLDGSDFLDGVCFPAHSADRALTPAATSVTGRPPMTGVI